MKKIVPLLACALGIQILHPSPGMALDCSQSMIAPVPGQPLSVSAIDANNACVTYLHQLSLATEESAKIAESERRIKGEKTPDKTTQPPLPAPLPHDDPTPLGAPLPLTDSLYVDQHGASATLLFADGSTAEVKTGTGLPDGLKVTAITRTGVFVRNANGDTLRLNDASAGFVAQPAHTNARPEPQRVGTTFSAPPGTH